MNVEADLREELGKLTKDLADVYQKIYERIEGMGPGSRLIAEKALKWLLCSRTRLYLEEFLTVVSIDTVAMTTMVTKENILHICSNLVTFDKELGSFRFAHLSVREFLEERTHVTLAAAHTLAATTCLSMCLDQQSDFTNKAVGPAQGYAYENWVHHCLGVESLGTQNALRQLFDDFLQIQAGQNLCFIRWAKWAGSDLLIVCSDDSISSLIREDSKPDPLFAACCLGLDWIVERHLCHVPDRRAEARQTTSYTKLPNFKAFNVEGNTYLHVAAANGHCNIVKLLLEHDFPVNAKNDFGNTALDYAVRARHVTVMQFLTRHGAIEISSPPDEFTTRNLLRLASIVYCCR